MDERTFRHHAPPFLLLGIMLVLMLGSYWNDAAIFDETAHIPAGYSYLFLRDYRLNPEHPPFIKAAAALPFLFYRVNFPTNTTGWMEEVNGQWEQGRVFLYEAGNNPDVILRLMRLPIIVLAVLFGWLAWRWVKKHFGHRVALLTLFFYAFSPTFIAHARLVTTDLGAALAFFIGLTAFINFLFRPTAKNILLAGLALGLAELIKFSLMLLVPIYGILLVGWVISRGNIDARRKWQIFFELLWKTLIIGAIAIAVIWAVYAYSVWNYPPERQLHDTAEILRTSPLGPLADFDLALTKNKFLRPLGEYFLGVLMVLQRTGGGNTTYFWGEVTAAGWRSYFPALYLFKEPLPFHILTLIAVVFGLKKIKGAPEKSRLAIKTWIREHFIEFSALTFIAVYWLSSVSSILNIGVRHVLPTFPFIYLLVSKEIISWVRSWKKDDIQNWWEWLKRIYKMYVVSVPRYLALWALVLWQAVSVLAAFPYFLSYYNALGGGTDQGYLIAGDSNYDWGQDLKRLSNFADANGIAKINVDYFGGGSPGYYLGGKFKPWWSARGYPPGGGWLAVSSSLQMGAYYTPVRGYTRRPEDGYEWLKPFRPVARAGKSIFIYKLPPLTL